MRLIPLLAAVFLSSCGYVSFGRAVSDDELRLRSDVRAYYDDAGVKVVRLEYERLGYESAVVLVTDRAGTRRESLAKRGRRWSITSSEKAEPSK